MDAIKSKMKALAQSTEEATARAKVFEDETIRVNEIADKFEEQVSTKFISLKFKVLNFSMQSFYRLDPFKRRCKLWKVNLIAAQSNFLMEKQN